MQHGRAGYLALLIVLLLAGALFALLPITSRLGALAADMVPGGEPIQISSASVPLQVNDRDLTKVGKLRYLGGLFLTSTDRRFGGFSGLIISPDGKNLLAISDRAYWLSARLTYVSGALSGMSDAVLAPILDAAGKPLRAPYFDSESIASLGGFPLGTPDGAVLVGFETRDRVDRYALGRDGFMARPAAVPMPEALKNAANNKALEGLVRLPDARLLAITEHTLDAHGNMIGWLVEPSGASAALTLKRDAPFDLTDLALGPNGDIFALERRYSPMAGAGMRIRRINPETLQGATVLDGEVLAELDMDYSIDNMEALAIRKSERGRTILYVLSDDNYSAAERTLLLMFALEE
jgi:hypothetical protein